MIKLTTSKPYGMFYNGELETLTDVSKYNGLSNIDKDYSAAIYIHGLLEEKLGFDIPRFLDGDFSDLLENEKQTVKIIYDVDGKTIEEDALMFLWVNIEHPGIKKIMGYIVDPGDGESVEFALKQQLKKPFNI